MADEPTFPRKVATAFYFLLVLMGIVYYIAWSIAFNTWDITKPENTGVYALTIILIGFGATGFFLYRTPARKPEPPQ